MRLSISMLAVTLAASTILATPAVYAAEKNTASNVTSLNKVTVVATRTEHNAFDVPGMVNVIDTDDAGLAGASTYSDLFANTPAVQFTGSSRRNGQAPTMRGYDANGVLVLIDGARQNFQSEHDGRFFIDPNIVKQVEVVRGANSSLYGSGAQGGVIAFETKDAADLLKPGQTMGAQVTSGYETAANEWNNNASVYGRAGGVDLLANATFAQSDDIRLGDGSDLRSDDELLNGFVKAGYTFNNYHTVKASFGAYNLDATEPNNPQGTRAKAVESQLVDKTSFSTNSRLAYSYDNPNDNLLKLKAQVYYNNTDVEEKILVATSTNAVGDKLDRELNTLGFNVDNQSSFRKGQQFGHVFSYGVDYYKDKQDGGDTGSATNTRGGVPDADATSYGAYIQDEIGFTDLGLVAGTLTITPGVRFDSYESDGPSGLNNDENATSPKIAANYKPVEWFNTFASYAESFRAPNLTELYETGRHFAVGPYVNNFVPNANLRPETAQTYEYGFGLDFKNVIQSQDQAQFKVSRYTTNADDYIYPAVTGFNITGACFGPGAPASCSAGTTQISNLPSATLNGVDMEAAYENKRLRVSLGYAQVSGKDDATGAPIDSLQPATLTTNVTVKLPEFDSLAGVRVTAARDQNKVTDPDYVRDGYGVADVYYRYAPSCKTLQNFTFDVGVDNVLDAEYSRVFAGALETGRNYKMQVRYTW